MVFAVGVFYNFVSLYRLTWAQRCWPRATDEFGSVSAISSFLLQDIPRHPDTRLFEVREVFKRSSLLGFQAYVRAYIAMFFASGGSPGACVQQTPNHQLMPWYAHEKKRVDLPCEAKTYGLGRFEPSLLPHYNHTLHSLE